MLGFLLAAAMLAAPAQRDDSQWTRDRAEAAALYQLGKDCDLDYDSGPKRGIDYRHEVDRTLQAMFKDPPACPGVAQRAARFVLDSVGDPERGDVDLAMLRRARLLVREGRLVPRDFAAEVRYARMLWLFAERMPWSGERGGYWEGEGQPEWKAWAQSAHALELLVARNGLALGRTTRSLELEAELRLRRDLPWYDPARAVKLYEDSKLSTSHANRQRVSRLLTDGVHLPRDFARAARPYRYTGSFDGTVADQAQRELLAIGRQAATAARTQAERLVALDILFGASLTGDAPALAERDALLRRLGAVPSVALAAGDAERAGRAVDWTIGNGFGSSWFATRTGLRPIRPRGLIGPDGRIVLAVVKQSSGDFRRDRIAMGAWFQKGRIADLSATARGRLVWTDLPEIDPLLDSFTAWRRWNGPAKR
jgi:hypothetical protein